MNNRRERETIAEDRGHWEEGEEEDEEQRRKLVTR